MFPAKCGGSPMTQSSPRSHRCTALSTVWIVAGLALTAMPLYAQNSQGTILGHVTDPSGAALPGASVTCPRIVPCELDRKSTRLNSSHVAISYAVFCLKKTIHTNTSY